MATLPGLLWAADLDRAEAESRLKEVLVEIDQLRLQLDSARSKHRGGQQRLREVDLQTQAANIELRALRARREERQADLARLEDRRASFIASLDQRLNELAGQVRAAYRDGRQSRMKLVLNQDDPALLSRLLAYYDYVSRAQADRIGLLRETLETLEQMQESFNRELERIADLTRQQRDLLRQLDTQRAERNALVAELAERISGGETRLQELERDRRDLEALIERLADVLADIPADLGSHLSVAQQKGRLPMPVSGPVRQAYGQGRSGGTSWQGWLIGADPGTEVRAVAYGRVAFADWLRGYGLLMIIDHGQGFMSLYGHNETLLHDAGAWVEPGEAISLVGSNPGSGQGLYFELRKAGRTLDPAGWIKR
jgi:septal ring factor EnvC (AmiA/AmiB activator)